jgi:3-hydroxyacyl-CoA dehydrogenase
VEAVKASAQLPLSEGLQLEAQLFESLMLSEESKSLRHVFFSERLSHKLPDLDDHIKPRAIHIVGIVGAGTMGSGIAISVLQAGLKVILVDQSQESLQKGGQSIERIIQDRIAKGKLTPAQAAALQSQLTLTDDWEALKTADLVIEAVFEEFKVKQAVFEKLDRLLKPNALLASNTSTLDINRLAQLTKRPDAVLGLHFFSPAHVMKLLEVVRGASTSKEALATAIQFAKTLKKIPVVAGVCDGFIGNRMLMPYIRMAESMVEQGASPLQVDNALEKFGMVMGPFRVSDLAGLDIGYAIRKRMRQANPSLPLSFSDRLVEAGRLGQKNLMGWYRYEGAKRKHTTDPIVQSMLERFRQDHSLGVKTFTDAEIVERCIYALINEGARCLGEGIALRASDIDLVYIYGYGFPPFRGGPMHYASRVGLQSIIHTLKTLSQQVDPFYSPAPALVEAYQSQQSL